ncbi:hypothetical protein SDRG_15832 [Saprolegnia diclina VS20]|uniref:Protein kinase domain-containing protein n=1 Tax=Saprolegnia diclina (strain VS20) TaxID=1156394 RepID=T0PZ25_SAPDV|nr:hypothetical protein SDRG_15832 [Saprolegnia diclina VS20]EQC26345.1 hypothetical protein SDRG_15832 [Saprolegnia diclina VS20]|eukprot:XP_008620238.1 hypothetical protein SDRG_15832 [Saprolegnia diclina VS20]
MVGTLTTTCANKTAPACVVYGPGNETDVTFSSGSTSLYVSVEVHVLHALPAGTATLYLEDNSLALIEPAFTAPAQLTAMSLRYNALDSALNVVQWPASLTNLDLTGNNMRVVNGSFTLPAMLRYLSLSTNNLTTIDGWRIPSTLLSLDLSFHYIETFNVDAASFAALRDIQVFSTVAIRPTSCAGTLETYQGAPDARTKEVLTHKICVVASTTTPAPTAVNKGTTAPATASPASSASSSATYIGIGVGVAVVLAVLAFVLIRRRRRPLSTTATPSTTDLRATFQQYQESQQREITSSKGSDGTFAYSYDIRSDPELNGYRIPKRELAQKQICGNGGFAIVYRALFQDQVVAVKELQAVHTRHATHVQAFMHEIQLFSTLHHDNIPMSAVQMALLVSTGKLTPTFRDDCPSDILALAKECLAMDPDDRPTAAQVSYALRKLLRAT